MKTPKIRHLVLLMAALCGAGIAMAADKAPAPPQSPPRVPFTAFRVKPILEPKLRDKNSLVTDDKPAKKQKTPAKTVKITQSSDEAPVIRVRPASKPTISVREVMDVPPRTSENILFSPQVDSPLVAASQPLRLSAKGVPVPPRKPQQMATSDSGSFNIIERVQALPDDPVSLPRPPADFVQPPVPQVQASPEPEVLAQEPPAQKSPAVVIPLAKPSTTVSTVRIRDPNRFSAQQRMAGAGAPVTASDYSSIRSLGLPDDMRNLNIGSLKQGKGVSPVLMPGYKETKAAPDDKRIDSKGIPNEVVVFFQENSADLEVGQMDVVNHDVVEMLRSRPDLELDIVGYSEPQQGGADATKKMSLSRALMLRQYLVRQRIDANRISVEGKGNNTPIEPRDRVEMYFDK
ncbi:MAG: OmpA family protein [Alphaproteobacteria bacterium]|nr:OmpA family protein [Alphaproteobacteria bacterium]